MLATPGSVHIGCTRSTRSAIQILAHHLESAVFIPCNLEPWKLGRDRFELREMFGRYSYITQTRGACAARDGDVCGAWARCEAMSGAQMAPGSVPLSAAPRRPGGCQSRTRRQAPFATTRAGAGHSGLCAHQRHAFYALRYPDSGLAPARAPISYIAPSQAVGIRSRSL